MGCLKLSYYEQGSTLKNEPVFFIKPLQKQESTSIFFPNAYTHGFNGKENDNEVFGSTGTFQNYGKRMFDTRTCRFISVDPIAKQYPELSTYQYGSLNPILNIDLDGLEGYNNNNVWVENLGTPKIFITKNEFQRGKNDPHNMYVYTPYKAPGHEDVAGMSPGGKDGYQGSYYKQVIPVKPASIIEEEKSGRKQELFGNFNSSKTGEEQIGNIGENYAGNELVKHIENEISIYKKEGGDLKDLQYIGVIAPNERELGLLKNVIGDVQKKYPDVKIVPGIRVEGQRDDGGGYTMKGPLNTKAQSENIESDKKKE
ncbi:MAG: hypothetical protein A2X08_14990 [Bacteroidetes bacterium GWA2_32_17]|nr:MAG: hypothetical protein A2X08_14990 [Bacteroidetes bacterium GWA2_32_17]